MADAEGARRWAQLTKLLAHVQSGGDFICVERERGTNNWYANMDTTGEDCMRDTPLAALTALLDRLEAT